ncbi:MAG: NYN domain-containing protein [Candidatus Paceibacterota bacterium]|jgi:uncharacterized LabA/DUF88 family protein
MNNKIIAYIDGANLHKATTRLGWMVDYKKLYTWLYEKYHTSEAYIFIGRVDKYQKLYSKMENAGFTLIFKETINDEYGQIKGNCDADLVLYSVRHVFEYYPNKVILISSDGDFSSLISFLKEKSIEITIISPNNRCSFLLRKLNVSILYLNTQKIFLKLSTQQQPIKEKALDGDETP